MKLKNDQQLTGRLAAYSALSSLLLWSADASAEVVYQNIDPDLLVNPGDTAYLDLDGDGTDDLMFWIRSQQGMISTAEGGSFSYTYRMAYASGLNNNVIFGEPGSSGGYEFLMPYNFSSGAFIADTLELFPGPARLAAFVQLDGIPFVSSGPWNGLSGMLGMRFKIGDDSHYAWIRLSVGMAATSITIEEYAWDDQANIGGITAGITAPVPEPALASAIQCWTDGQAVLVQRPEEWQVHYSLFDLQGRLIPFTQQAGQPDRLLPATAVQDGIYLVQISSAEHGTATRKIFLASGF
ncbi:MAG: T9SS type A sorting domain-containing protein [Chitinophagales bacterium]|nr:T9SS type A sorting domain-containing protein [Chitinophagales bacterium]HAE13015.1 hypothetical protein [Bacteroidota bacterium]MCB9022052.1 T9SS type A sorting domain-containing protein [Chitinophagales bacterium]MCB9031781.1 T9SS type A sorting domain-containing protein [Chitinophagales bacterium]HAE35328.1 hypothetical protein [Bacteroidota bacterium]